MAEWYEIIEGEELQQGDFFQNCPIALPPKLLITMDQKAHPPAPPENVTVKIRTYDVVVMSQSCDLVAREGHVELAIVCPHWSLTEMENQVGSKSSDFFRSRKGKEEIRRGNIPGYHMLASCNLQDFSREIQIVDLKTVLSIPFDFLTELARSRHNRLRLLSPYREHLAQSFARFFMRVGLPSDIPSFN